MIGFKEIAKELKDRTGYLNTLNDLVCHLSLNTSLEKLPSRVTFDVDDILKSSIKPADIVSTVKTVHRINSAELHQQRPLLVTLRAKHAISEEDTEKFKLAGFDGITPRGPEYGVPTAADAWRELYKHGGHWPDYLVNKKQNNNTIIIPRKKVVEEIYLTTRQQQIIWIIQTRGLPNRLIAKELNISESAVKMHLGIIFKKYCVQNRTQLVALLKRVN